MHLRVAMVALALGLASEAIAAPYDEDLADLSLEELGSVEVTSASKRSEPEIGVAAAIYVITAEDIRHAGATSLPEALRLAPGLEVARIDANKWAVGVRGFGSRLARSILVLIDGRSVFSPLFRGTYWEVQDTLLEDIDRIEVIRGPGGALWGANAVNGVINIITRSARETQGTLATGAAGSEERGAVAVRQGGQLGEHLFYRAYAKYFDRDEQKAAPGVTPFDEWRMGQVGFRADYDGSERDRFTLQGDLYAGRSGQRVMVSFYDPPSLVPLSGEAELFGGNVLGRWDHRFASAGDSTLRIYYDRTGRDDLNFDETRDTVDAEFDHRFAFWRQVVVWGAGYRLSAARTSSISPTIRFQPPNRTDHLVTAFLQDELAIVPDRLRFIAGVKLEHNAFTGFEVQPTLRAAWTPNSTNTIWAAVSRSVRAASPTDQDRVVDTLVDAAGPTFRRLQGSRDVKSEVIRALEGGYRGEIGKRVAVALSVFYNLYSNLVSQEPGDAFPEAEPPPPHTIMPLTLGNGIEGHSYGGEFRYDLSVTRWLQLHGFYSYVRLDMRPRPGSLDTTTEANLEGTSPRHQVSLRAWLRLPRHLGLDLTFRFVDELPAQQVDAYANLDVRLAWSPSRNQEIALVAQNLLQDHHFEFAASNPLTTQVQRGVYGKVTFRW
jgi:iron complex outermembrane receptor protein